MPLTQVLEQLVDTLEGKGLSIRPYLRPGLSRPNLEVVLESRGLKPPEELYQLYEWHDGIDGMAAPELLFGEHQFLPFEEAVQLYADLQRYYGQVVSAVDVTKCFPFASFQGAHTALLCAPDLVEGLQHPVFDISEGIGVAFEDLERMAQTVSEWFSSGLYDSEPVDNALRLAIWKRLNPQIRYRTTTL